MTLATLHAKSKRPLVFLAVGIFNTLLDFAFYSLLTSFLLKGSQNIALAGLVSGTFALICAFITHSLITWRDHPASRRTLVKFVLFTGFGMWVIRPILLSVFIHATPLYQLVRAVITGVGVPLSYNFVANTGAFGLMLVIVLSYNYVVYSRFVFRQAVSTDTEPENHSAS